MENRHEIVHVMMKMTVAMTAAAAATAVVMTTAAISNSFIIIDLLLNPSCFLYAKLSLYC